LNLEPSPTIQFSETDETCDFDFILAFCRVGISRGSAFYFIHSTESTTFFDFISTSSPASHSISEWTIPSATALQRGAGCEAESTRCFVSVGGRLRLRVSSTGALYLLASAVLVNNFFSVSLRTDSLFPRRSGRLYLLAGAHLVNNFFQSLFRSSAFRSFRRPGRCIYLSAPVSSTPFFSEPRFGVSLVPTAKWDR
jgi:hypothetical protein